MELHYPAAGHTSYVRSKKFLMYNQHYSWNHKGLCTFSKILQLNLVGGYFFLLVIGIYMWHNVHVSMCNTISNTYANTNIFCITCSYVGGPESSPGQSQFPSSTDLKPQWSSRSVLYVRMTTFTELLLYFCNIFHQLRGLLFNGRTNETMEPMSFWYKIKCS